MPLVLLALGILLTIIGWFWFLFIAFDDSILWGLGVFLVPFVALIYGIMNFSEAKKPFCLYLIGMGLMIAGRFMLAPEVPVAG